MRGFPKVVLLFLGFLLSNIPIVHAQFLEAGVGKFKIPVEAPGFILKEVEGGKVSLQELRGKIIVLNFFTIN